MAGRRNDDDYQKFTSNDLQNILEVNKKAIEIYIEVEKQNEDTLESLERLEENQKDALKTIEKIDRSIFKLILLLGSLSIGTIVAIIDLILRLTK